MRWALWELVELEDDRVTVGYRLHPQPGWDHFLDLRTTYARSTTRVSSSRRPRATSARRPRPSATAPTPTSPSATRLLPDVELRIPAATVGRGRRAAAPRRRRTRSTAAPYDFRAAHRVGGARLDTAYTDVVRDEDGLWRCTVAAADRAMTLWADAAFPWLQVFTAIAEDRKGEVGIAVEPMSLPGRRLQLGRRARRPRAGRGVDGTWGISPA